MAKAPRRNALADDFGGGVGQIFGASVPVLPAGVEDLDNARTIEVDLLTSNPYQPRTTFDDVALQELAADIAAHGVLQPLLVRRHPEAHGRYQIVAGERRWRAARQAGLADVPCIERTMDDAAMERLALVENVQRADLDPVDEAHAYKRLIAGGLSERQVAASIHKVHSYVAQRLLLIKYPSVEREVQAGTIGPTVATGLARLTDDTQREALLGRARRGERVTLEDLKAVKESLDTPVGDVDGRVANISHPTREERPVQAPVEAAGKRTTRPAAPPGPPDDALTVALEPLAVAALDALLAYGEARGWSCAELARAIRELRGDA